MTTEPSPLQPLDWLDEPILVQRPSATQEELIAELRAAVEELVTAVESLAHKLGE